MIRYSVGTLGQCEIDEDGTSDQGLWVEAYVARDLLNALREVTEWAGKDKRRMVRRGWTIEKQMASLNRAAKAIVLAESGGLEG